MRASARNRDVLAARNWQGVELVRSRRAAARIASAIAGIDTAFYLVHSMAAGSDFGRLDLEAADNFARAAAGAGVKRIVYLGGLVPGDADSEHLLSRRDTGERLRAHPVPVTEIRAGIIVGPGSAAFRGHARPGAAPAGHDHAALGAAPPNPRRWRSPTCLHYLARSPARSPAMAGGIYDAAGPETLTYEAMMRAIARLMGRRAPWIIPVPVLTPELSAPLAAEVRHRRADQHRARAHRRAQA